MYLVYDRGDKPCPAREMYMEDPIRDAERIPKKIDERWPNGK